MLYMPASTLAIPIVLQETQPLPPPTRYMMLQPAATMIPALPYLNASFVYPGYSFVTKSVEKNNSEKTLQQTTLTQPVQHIVHHCACSIKTACPGYCELCCPWIDHSNERQSRSRSRSHSRSRSPSPPTRDHQRYSRRDEFDRSKSDNQHETVDEKIERIRQELDSKSFSKHDKSTETIHYYRPPSTPPVQQRVPYKQHYDAPKPRSRSRSRPRSTSSHRASSLPREPWRSSNQNDYPWRDAHLPAYREATLARTQTPSNQSRTWNESAHHQSHSNTENSTSYYDRKDYVYRPKSETEARKWYTQSTGKDADREVHQALHRGVSAYNYTGSDTHSCHGFYSDIPTTTKTHSLHKIDATQYHNLYGCNEPCLHIVPKQGSTLDPPYLKILNAPVTYLH